MRSEATDIASAVSSGGPAFLEAMARLAATVHIVTARHDGARHGMTITAASSLSADPLSVVLCIHREASAHAAIIAAGTLSLNMLADEHADVAGRFAGQFGHRGAERFREGSWDDNPGYGPAFAQALARLDCRIAFSRPFGTHSVLACQVERVTLGPKRRALLYADRGYATHVAADPPAAGL